MFSQADHSSNAPGDMIPRKSVADLQLIVPNKPSPASSPCRLRSGRRFHRDQELQKDPCINTEATKQIPSAANRNINVSAERVKTIVAEAINESMGESWKKEMKNLFAR